MAERSGDWVRQARRDLDSARAQRATEFFEWACFISQQAGEKALKAVFQKLGGEAWDHSIVDLLRTWQERMEVPAELHTSAVNPDRYYIPSRYPNGWAAGSPADYFTSDSIDREQLRLSSASGFRIDELFIAAFLHADRTTFLALVAEKLARTSMSPVQLLPPAVDLSGRRSRREPNLAPRFGNTRVGAARGVRAGGHDPLARALGCTGRARWSPTKRLDLRASLARHPAGDGALP